MVAPPQYIDHGADSFRRRNAGSIWPGMSRSRPLCLLETGMLGATLKHGDFTNEKHVFLLNQWDFYYSLAKRKLKATTIRSAEFTNKEYSSCFSLHLSTNFNENVDFITLNWQ